jgi:hypothetical protein
MDCKGNMDDFIAPSMFSSVPLTSTFILYLNVVNHPIIHLNVDANLERFKKIFLVFSLFLSRIGKFFFETRTRS